MNLFRRQPALDRYLADMHLYVDDLRELQDLRSKAKGIPDNEKEIEFYTRLIEGAQLVLQYMQNKVTEGEK